MDDIVYGNLEINYPIALHEYSIFAMKLRLNDDNVIAFPTAACEPLNA